ncbi:MAG: aminoacyl-tRNA hydrolase [Clostridia bacterium]|nr:aminoacyl-tRNA hydrolase [Clostridia bacterium]
MADIFDLFKKISKNDTVSTAPITHIVVGLGNPGAKYANTRHNAGFMTLDYISSRLGVKVDRAKFEALVGEATVAGKRVLLMKPQTFMNNSGNAVYEAAKFYKIAPENVIVISDDVNLDVGRLRVRGSGSAGGQKGLNDIIVQMGSDKIPRIRIGVGKKPHPDYDMVDWVLGAFPEADKKALDEVYARAYDGLEKLLSGDVDGAMQICNGAK